MGQALQLPVQANQKGYLGILEEQRNSENKDVIRHDGNPTGGDSPVQPMRKLSVEHNAKFTPQKVDGIIRLQVNRSFYMKPGERKLVCMPIKANCDVLLHPVIHPTMKVSTGLQKRGQYFKLTITNIADDMVHVTDRMTLTCLKRNAPDTWQIEHRGGTSILHFFN